MNQTAHTAGQAGKTQKGNDNPFLFTPPADWHESQRRPDLLVVNGVVCRPCDWGEDKLRKE